MNNSLTPCAGKYRANNSIRPSGPRRGLFTDQRLRDVEPLISLLEAMGKEKGKTPTQLALNWCICKGTLPIPGAKDAQQVRL